MDQERGSSLSSHYLSEVPWPWVLSSLILSLLLPRLPAVSLQQEREGLLFPDLSSKCGRNRGRLVSLPHHLPYLWGTGGP